MFDKINNPALRLVLKIIAAVVITRVYSYAVLMGGNIVAAISLKFTTLFENKAVQYAVIFAPAVLLFTFIDNLLFKPLLKLFGHSAWVYFILSGNFMTLRFIYVIIEAAATSGESYLGLSQIAALLLVVPTVCFLCGVLFCFLIRLFKRYKLKNDGGTAVESAELPAEDYDFNFKR